MTHRWNNNTCIHCGISRERRTETLLMAITDFPPYNHYRYQVKWWYGNKHGFKRPDCIRSKKQL